jgi:hypothetical protein
MALGLRFALRLRHTSLRISYGEGLARQDRGYRQRKSLTRTEVNERVRISYFQGLLRLEHEFEIYLMFCC